MKLGAEGSDNELLSMQIYKSKKKREIEREEGENGVDDWLKHNKSEVHPSASPGQSNQPSKSIY